MMLVSEIGEFGLIGRLAQRGLVHDVGDDCAIVTPPAGADMVLTADALIEGVHFLPGWISWRALGRKSLAVNISDLAAMGAEPVGALITLGLRADAAVADVEDLYRGMGDLAHHVPIVGGDVVASPTATAISITAFGFVPRGQALSRGGAEPGDDLWVTGPLGDSAGGLRLLRDGAGGTEDRAEVALIGAHLQPDPRVREGIALRASRCVHAMMDLSDGLAGDLGHMLAASSTAAVVRESALPLSGDLATVGRERGWDVLDMALRGGEDYELLFAAPPEARNAIRAAVAAVSACEPVRIGEVVEGSGAALERSDGRREPLEPRAFRHF